MVGAHIGNIFHLFPIPGRKEGLSLHEHGVCHYDDLTESLGRMVMFTVMVIVKSTAHRMRWQMMKKIDTHW